MRNKIIKHASLLAIATMAFANLACETKSASFSLLATQDTFKQSVVIYKPSKVDILWVVDNSNSMMTSQGHLADNYQYFINRFQTLNYDYHMSVTQTDAWKTLFNKPCIHDLDTTCSHIKDGGDIHTGVFVMDPFTPNISNVFVNNVKLGTAGSGDERAFQSFYAALNDPYNAAFRRKDAFLAVIIISDEDDFSEDTFTDLTPSALPKYSIDPATHYLDPLHPIQKYVDFLDTYTNKSQTSTLRNYSVSAITILEQTCANQLAVDGFTNRYPGLRYQQLADATGGVKGSLCDDFGNTLQVVSDSIIEYSSVFKLDRVPVNGSISVVVNGVTVPQDPVNGWTYLSADNAIQFHGTSIPPADAQIAINYDPTTVKL